jgi:purine-binding chemotaxis protein CheW
VDEASNPKLRMVSFEYDEASRKRVLEERARSLSQASLSLDEAEDDAFGQVVCFRCGESNYGVPLTYLKKIQTVTQAAVVPCTPKFVLGLIEVHREIVVAVDLVLFLGHRRLIALTSPYTLLVIRVGEHSLGLVCDELFDVIAAPPQRLRVLPATVGRTEREVAAGYLVEEKLMVLDAAALVSHQRLRTG